MGAPTGNTNARKENREWSDAIRKAVKQGKKLRPLADKLIAKALEGDIQALKEIGDRYEGKIPQTQKVEGTEPDGSHKLIVEVVRFADKNPE